MLDPVGIYGPVRGVSSTQRKADSSNPSTKTSDSARDAEKTEAGTAGRAGPSASRVSDINSSSAISRAQERSRAAAAAAKRERQEWERTRGAGSSVLLWYEDVRVNNPSELDHFSWTAAEVVPPLADVLARKHEPQDIVGMDRLLDWGICDYTILPRTLGRGRFSTVYLAVKNGQRFAIKHTPLFPHHELVATRLLREPTLLAELPPHPNLVGVVETIRTPGHFYLVEEYLEGYVTLEALIPKLSTTKSPKAPVLPLAIAEKIFSQLVLVLYAIHWPLRVCHRDVKPENILVHPETLHLKLLDFGLATHFSKSRAKLTTCCGSPAFHCPEIVTALTQPPGTMAYWGPEVDAWTCGVTLLRCLSGIRYPLGTSHPSPQSMANRAKRVLQTLPAHPLREQIARLLDLNGEKRMKHFEEIAQYYLARQDDAQPSLRRELRSTSFCPNLPQYSMPLTLVLENDVPGQPSAGTQPFSELLPAGAESPQYTRLTLLNPNKLHSLRVLSFIKYCFRCAGILYHTLPESDDRTIQRLHWQSGLGVGELSAGVSVPSTPYGDPGVTNRTFECVVELTHEEAQGPLSTLMHSLMTMFGQRPKPDPLVILPPHAKDTEEGAALPEPGKDKAVRPSSGPSGKQGQLKMLVFQVLVAFPPAAESPSYDTFPDLVLHNPPGEGSTRFPAPLPTRKDSHPGPLSEEPGLMIDTRPEALPQPSAVTSPITRWAPSPMPSGRRSRRGASVRPNTVHMYISDPRAVPYVRGALSNGGVSKPDVSVTHVPEMERSLSSDRPSAPPQVSLASPVRSGATTPGAEDAVLEPFNADELVASLDAIESACRATLRRRTKELGEGPEQTASEPKTRVLAQNLYRLVLRLFTQLESTLNEAEQSEALREQMAELNFRVLDVLAPALSLVSAVDSLPADQVQLVANVGAESGEERAASTGSLALAILELFAHNSSAKEMCLGIQEQIERLSLAYQTRAVAPGGEASNGDEASAAPLLQDDAMVVQALFGLLQLLSVVLPDIKTRKPQTMLEPIVTLLYPRLYFGVLPFALARVQDGDVAEELATQAAVLLCELVLTIRSFCKPFVHDGHKDLPELGGLLINGLAPLIPFLPHTCSGSSHEVHSRLLALRLYSAANASLSDSDLMDVSSRVTVWNVVRKTYDKLDLDLGERCLGPAPGHKSHAPTDTTMARGALELLVQQLAYEAFMARVKGRTRDRLRCRTQHATYLGEPARWSADVARELLERLGAVLPTTLVPGLTLLFLPPGREALERTQDVQETDAFLSLVFWSLATLDQHAVHKPLEEASATNLVRALSLFATCSPVPPLRQAAFALVTRVLRDYAADDLVLRLVHEMLEGDTPAPLRAAAVSLVRELCRTHIAALEDAHAENADADDLLAHGRLWDTLHDELFVVPELPEASVEAQDALESCFAQWNAYLIECCALYYFVLTRDTHGYTGLAAPLLRTRVEERFVAPLRTMLHAWKAHDAALRPELRTELQLLGTNVERMEQVPAAREGAT
ncbi:hypothetical protein CBS14141_000262 [Malassezia furfur]|nr:hypothetical protein CBS14141_000262 [Malassezia furfur]